MTKTWRLWCEFFSLRQKRFPKSNWETATHRKTVQVLAMEHISYNKTFDSLSGFKETFENEDCAYVISAQQIRRSNSIYKSYSIFRRQFTLICECFLTIVLAISRALETSKQVFLTGSCCILLKFRLLLSTDKDKKSPKNCY